MNQILATPNACPDPLGSQSEGIIRSKMAQTFDKLRQLRTNHGDADVRKITVQLPGMSHDAAVIADVVVHVTS